MNQCAAEPVAAFHWKNQTKLFLCGELSGQDFERILKRNIDQTIEFVRMKNVMNPDTEMLVVMLKQ